MALTGVAPDGTIVLALIVSPKFPVDVPVEKKMVPLVAPALDPLIVQFWTVLLVASAMKRIVVALVAETVFSRVSAFPPVFSPSMVTLSAPLRSTRGPVIGPLIIRAAPPTGVMRIEVYDAAPVPLAFRTADTFSVVLPHTSRVSVPVWVPALIASNAAFSVG